MTSAKAFLAGTKIEIDAIRKALDQAEGLPIRGTSVGGPDFVPQEQYRDEAGNSLPTPGWTTSTTEEPIEVGVIQAIELPDTLRKHLGKVVTVNGKQIAIPNTDQLLDENTLPASIKAARQARKDADTAFVSQADDADAANIMSAVRAKTLKR